VNSGILFSYSRTVTAGMQLCLVTLNERGICCDIDPASRLNTVDVRAEGIQPFDYEAFTRPSARVTDVLTGEMRRIIVADATGVNSGIGLANLI
jgi:hypothetical protein